MSKTVDFRFRKITVYGEGYTHVHKDIEINIIAIITDTVLGQGAHTEGNNQLCLRESVKFCDRVDT